MWTVNVWVEVMVFLHQCPGTTGAIKVHTVMIDKKLTTISSELILKNL